MSQELHYTSVPRGLKPGTRGFCTVAMTPQISGPLLERLENLSGYQPVYPPHDPSAALNPVNFAHVRFSLGGRPLSILSRVGPAGLDYTGRTNKYAHHVVLDAAERPEGGPAWLLGHPGFMQGAWDGEPRMLEEGRPVPRGDRPGGIATAWAALTGDAGWAGVLAEAFLTDPKRPAFLIFRPGMDLLPLLAEAIALLPPPRRWDVEFSTYLTQAPRGVTYAWRGVLEGSQEAASARRLPGALAIDLCGTLERAAGGPLVHYARTGEHREWIGVAGPGPMPSAPVRDAVASTGRPTTGTASLRPSLPPSPAGNYELIPELAARLSARDGQSPEELRISRRSGRRTGILVSLILAIGVVPIAAAGFLFRDQIMRLLGRNPEVSEKLAEQQRIVAERKEEKQRADEPREIVVEAAPAKARAPVPEPRSTPTTAPAPVDASTKPQEKAKQEAPRAVAHARPSTTIRPLFLRLKEPVSALTAGVAQEPIKIPDSTFAFSRMKLLACSALHPQPSADGHELAVLSESPGSLESKPRKLATFQFLAPGEIRFRWANIRPDELTAERARLRDCVLEIRSGDGAVKYCILRDAISPPADANEFTARLDSGSRSDCTYNIYNWDEGGIYYDKLRNLHLADCVLQGSGDGTVPELKEGEHGRWVAASASGTPLLTVELARVHFQRGIDGLKPVVETNDRELIPVGREMKKKPPETQRRDAAGAKGSDEWSVVLITLFDREPQRLRERISQIERAIEGHRKELEALGDKDEKKTRSSILRKIDELEVESKRLQVLNAVYNSLISFKIIWQVEGLRLELLDFDARKLTPNGGPPTP